VAVQCHTAPFQVLKTALPHGWLGQRGWRPPPARRPNSAAWCASSPPGRIGRRG
jgi:hypothetical protein